MRFSQVKSKSSDRYLVSTAVVMGEVFKLVMNLAIIYVKEYRFRLTRTVKAIGGGFASQFLFHLKTPHPKTPHPKTPPAKTPHPKTLHPKTPHPKTPHPKTPHPKTPHPKTPHPKMPHPKTPYLKRFHLKNSLKTWLR